MEGLGGFLPIILLIGVFYLFFIRPEMKRKKKEKNFIQELKRGDKIVTKSGMYGKILELNDGKDTVVIETGAGKITFDRSAISSEMSQKRNNPEGDKKVIKKK